MDDVKYLKEAVDKIEVKIDKLDGKLDSMQTVHATNSESLVRHIVRTDYLQEEVQILKDQVMPIAKHVAYATGVIKFFGIVAAICSAVAVILEILSFF